MVDRSRVYVCRNAACAEHGMRVTVYGQLVGVKFLSWPSLTCSACGQAATVVLDPPAKPEFSAPPAKPPVTRPKRG